MAGMLGRPSIVWLPLIAATLISVEFINKIVPAPYGIAAIMALAAAKATLVIWYFMGMASAPAAWRIGFASLVWLGAAMIVILNLLA